MGYKKGREGKLDNIKINEDFDKVDTINASFSTSKASLSPNISSNELKLNDLKEEGVINSQNIDFIDKTYKQVALDLAFNKEDFSFNDKIYLTFSFSFLNEEITHSSFMLGLGFEITNSNGDNYLFNLVNI